MKKMWNSVLHSVVFNLIYIFKKIYIFYIRIHTHNMEKERKEDKIYVLRGMGEWMRRWKKPRYWLQRFKAKPNIINKVFYLNRTSLSLIYLCFKVLKHFMKRLCFWNVIAKLHNLYTKNYWSLLGSSNWKFYQVSK